MRKFGCKTDKSLTPNGVPKVTPASKYTTNFQLIFFHILGIIEKLAIISRRRIIGTISLGGNIKDNKETLEAEKPKPLKPLTKDAKRITPQKIKSKKTEIYRFQVFHKSFYYELLYLT